MSSDHETTLVNKLKKLTNSSQSIQSLSLWIIYHAQKYRESVGVWTREIHKAKPKQKLTLLYLANDVMQNSKKKTQDFVNEFAAVLPDILQSSYHAMSSSEQGSVSRMVKIWEERSVLSSTQIGAIRKAMESGSSAAGSASATTIATAIPINHVVKALQDLDQIENENKPFKAEDSKIKQDYQSFLEKARNEKILTTMGLKELQSLRIEYDAHIKQLSALRSALTNENEKRNKYMQALRQELQQQSDQYHRLDEQIQTWNTYTMNIQNFLTKVEININQKKLEFEFDDRDNKKRGLHELSSSDNDDLVANIFGDDSHTGGGDVDDSHPFKKQKLDNSSSSNGVLQEYEPLMDVNKFMNEAAPQTDVSAILSAISTEEINDSTRGVYSMEQPFQVQLQRTGGMNHENSLGLGADFFSDDQNL